MLSGMNPAFAVTTSNSLPDEGMQGLAVMWMIHRGGTDGHHPLRRLE